MIKELLLLSETNDDSTSQLEYADSIVSSAVSFIDANTFDEDDPDFINLDQMADKMFDRYWDMRKHLTHPSPQEVKRMVNLAHQIDYLVGKYEEFYNEDAY